MAYQMSEADKTFYDASPKSSNNTNNSPTPSSSGFSALGGSSNPAPASNNTYAPGSAAGPLTQQQQQQAQQTGQAYITPSNGVGAIYPQQMDYSSMFNQLQSNFQQQLQGINQQFQALKDQQSDYQKVQSQQQLQQQKQTEQQYNALKQNQQNQLLELRSIANQNNVPIGYQNGQVTIDDQVINPDEYGLQNINGRYMGTSDQIAAALSGGKLKGVRSTLEGQGYNVGYNNGQIDVNGIPVDTSNMVNIGGRFYTNPEGIQDIQMRTGGQVPINVQGNVQNTVANSQVTAISKEQSDLHDLNTLITEMAKMKPPEADTKTMVALLKGLQEYKRPYDDQIKSLLQSTMTKFEYNPDNDPLLKKAVEYADKRLLEQMNSRGILSSTLTVDNLAKVKEDLIPQYQQIAMEQYYKNLDNAFRQIGVFQQLNQDDYSQYYNMVSKSIDVLDKVNQNTIDTWKNTFTFMSDILGKKADLITKEANAKRDDIKMALDKVNSLGYVDNESSLVLGLPVGTPSYKAQADALSRYDEYNKMALQAKDEKEKIRLQGENTVKEIQAKAEIKNQEEGLMAAASNIDAQLRQYSASQARDYVVKNTSEILKQTGSAGYKYLLESIAKREETEFNNTMKERSEDRADYRARLSAAASDRAAQAAERAANKITKSPYYERIHDSIGKLIEQYEEDPNVIVKNSVYNEKTKEWGTGDQTVKDWLRTPGSVQNKTIIQKVIQNPTLSDEEKYMILEDYNIPY